MRKRLCGSPEDPQRGSNAISWFVYTCLLSPGEERTVVGSKQLLSANQRFCNYTRCFDVKEERG